MQLGSWTSMHEYFPIQQFHLPDDWPALQQHPTDTHWKDHPEGGIHATAMLWNHQDQQTPEFGEPHAPHIGQ